MINLTFYKPKENSVDRLGNKTYTDEVVAVAEGSIGVITDNLVQNDFDYGLTTYKVTIPYSEQIAEEATKVMAEGIGYIILNKTKTRRTNKLIIYCRKAK